MACLLLAVLGGWTPLATRINQDAYDWMYRLHPPATPEPQCLLVAVDEQSLSANGGLRGFRSALADAVQRLQPHRPSVIALDAILADAGDPKTDAALVQAMRGGAPVVLAADIEPAAREWEQPTPALWKAAAALGHVHADQDVEDGVARRLPLEKAAAGRRYWALALEAARLHSGAGPIVETPDSIQLGQQVIPSSRRKGRTILIRFRSSLPTLSLLELQRHPERGAAARGKAVFIGMTAQSAVRDRLMVPLSSSTDSMMPGVAINAHGFETILHGNWLTDASDATLILLCATIIALMGLIFWRLTGWWSYLAGGLLLVGAHLLPHYAFTRWLVLPTFPLAAAGWLSLVTAAAYQYFVVRKRLRRSEDDRARYQQAIHFVTHEMRTPLTAIQGSSELMNRYNLPEEKRRQMVTTINDESKRLARLISTFLDVERLTDGQLALRSEAVELPEWVRVCLERAQPLAERKQITLLAVEQAPLRLEGDRELLEYALYNLLTNAVKYSAPETTVRVAALQAGREVHVSVRDQGMGMDEQEVRRIFQKFYRTRKAEASGEVGTGIGLSIVEQIVTRHGGRVEVTSQPGQGSCFTLVLPVVNKA